MAPQAAWGETLRDEDVDIYNDEDDDDDPGPRTLDEVLSSVRQHVIQRRLRVKQCFSDFDRLNRGKCTKHQFLRALKVLISGLPTEEAELLAESYIEPISRYGHFPQIVCFGRFVEDVDQVFRGRPDLDKHKVAAPGAVGWCLGPGLAQPAEVRPPPLPRCGSAGSLRQSCGGCGSGRSAASTAPSSGRAAEAEGVLETRPASTTIRPASAVGSDQVLPERALRLRRPMSACSFSSWRPTPPAVGAAPPVLPDSAYFVEPRPAPAVPPAPFPRRPLSAMVARAKRVEIVPRFDVLSKLKALVGERRLRLMDYFQDFDKLRKGSCTASNLRTVLTLLRLDLDPKSFDDLFEQFRADNGDFRYWDLCTEVGEHAASAPLSRGAGERPQSSKPSAVGSRPQSATLASQTIRRQARLGAEDQARVQELRQRLRNRVRMRGMEIKTIFDDMNKRCGIALPGHVTISQFPRIMATLQFALTELEVEILSQAYCDTDDGQSFNYFAFCGDIDPTLQMSVSTRCRPPSAAQTAQRGTGVVGALVKHVVEPNPPGACGSLSLGVVGVGLSSATRGAGGGDSGACTPTTCEPSLFVAAGQRRVPYNRYFDNSGRVVPRCRPASAPAGRRCASQPSL